MTWKDFLTTKFALWIDTRSSIDNTLHGSGRAMGKSGILLQIKKHLKLVVIFHATCLALAHLILTDPSGILTIEK